MVRLRKLAVVFSLFGPAAFSQFETSEVLGTVRDTSQMVASKATVTLVNQDTGVQAKTTTDDNGNYNFFNVKGV